MPPNRAGQIPDRIHYLVHLREAQIQIQPETIPTLLAATTLPFQRQREKRLQSVDLRPALLAVRTTPEGDLELEVHPSQSGTARPLEVLSLLTQTPVEQLKRVRVTKTRMEMLPLEKPPNSTAETMLENPEPEAETPDSAE